MYPMRIPPKVMRYGVYEQINRPECICCGECKQVCSKGVIHINMTI